METMPGCSTPDVAWQYNVLREFTSSFSNDLLIIHNTHIAFFAALFLTYLWLTNQFAAK